MSSNPYLFKIQGTDEIAAGVYYEVDLSAAPIGRGGMGAVYRGFRVEEHSGVRKEVAVKFLQENLPPSVISRAQREASIRLKNDNLVEMIAFVRVDQVDPYGKTVSRLHVVSELLRGVMLFDLLHGKTQDVYGNEVPYAVELLNLYKDSPENFAVKIGKKVLSGIMALHDAGYIHRDIDPSNIMITHDRKVKLIDFGIARAHNKLKEESHLTSAGSFLGKAAYASPELVLGDIQHQNETTDLYAIGILLFQLCTGKLPFIGAAQDVLDQQCKSPMPLDRIKDKKIRKIIQKATEKSQSKRYQTAAEFIVALDQYIKENANSVTNDNIKEEQPVVNVDPYLSSDVSGTLLQEDNNVNTNSQSSPYTQSDISNTGTVSLENKPLGTTPPTDIEAQNVVKAKGRPLPWWVWFCVAVFGLVVGLCVGLLV